MMSQQDPSTSYERSGQGSMALRQPAAGGLKKDQVYNMKTRAEGLRLKWQARIRQLRTPNYQAQR